jgi:hypothetical protein
MLTTPVNITKYHLTFKACKRNGAKEMPRVTFVKSAQKKNPVCDVGGSYYWWKFRFGGKRFSLTYPKASQLTQSEYYGRLYDLQEQVQNATLENEDDFTAFRDDIASEVREIGEECTEKRDNMPEGLQDAPTGELLQERADACENAADEIDNMECPDEWQEILDLQDEHEEWESREPQLDDFEASEEDGTVAEQHAVAHEEWTDDKPGEVDEPEAADLSEMDDAISNCIV